MLNNYMVVYFYIILFCGVILNHYLCSVSERQEQKGKSKGDSFRSYLTYKLQSQS